MRKVKYPDVDWTVYQTAIEHTLINVCVVLMSPLVWLTCFVYLNRNIFKR